MCVSLLSQICCKNISFCPSNPGKLGCIWGMVNKCRPGDVLCIHWYDWNGLHPNSHHLKVVAITSEFINESYTNIPSWIRIFLLFIHVSVNVVGPSGTDFFWRCCSFLLQSKIHYICRIIARLNLFFWVTMSRSHLSGGRVLSYLSVYHSIPIYLSIYLSLYIYIWTSICTSIYLCL